jgi:hypothetical protein
MANFLLTSQTLLDLLDRHANPARNWASGITAGALRLSVVSIAEAQAAIDAVTDSTARARLEANLKSLLSALEAHGGPPLAFEQAHADAWRALLNDPLLGDLETTRRQVYATALQESLTVVEERHAHTDALLALGVDLHVL